MKKLEQLYEEIVGSEALKKDFAAVLAKQDKTALLGFCRENGCDASLEEVRAFLKEKMAEGVISSELTDAELEQVTGGSELAVGIFATVTLTQCIVYTFLL